MGTEEKKERKIDGSSIYKTQGFRLGIAINMIHFTMIAKKMEKKLWTGCRLWPNPTLEVTQYTYAQFLRAQGVRFTDISCATGGLCVSWYEGMTSRCKDLRAVVSCANEGRRFGSLARETIQTKLEIYVVKLYGTEGLNPWQEKPFSLQCFKVVKINGTEWITKSIPQHYGYIL